MYAHAVRYADTRKGTMTALRVTVDQVARIGFVSVVDFTWNRPIDFPTLVICTGRSWREGGYQTQSGHLDTESPTTE